MKLTPLASAVALLGLSSAVLAQSPAVQRVEITGSSIKRIAAEGALPVQVITRADLDRQGIVTTEQLIASLTVNGNGLDNLASNADVVAGAVHHPNRRAWQPLGHARGLRAELRIPLAHHEGHRHGDLG